MKFKEEGEERSYSKVQDHIHDDTGENDEQYTKKAENNNMVGKATTDKGKMSEERIIAFHNIEENTVKTKSHGLGIVYNQMEIDKAVDQMEVSHQIEARVQMEARGQIEAGNQIEVSDQIEADCQMMAPDLIKFGILSFESDKTSRDETGHDKGDFHIHTSSSGSVRNMKKLSNTDENKATENEASKTVYKNEVENRGKTDESEAENKGETLDKISEYESNYEVEVKIQ